MKENRGFILALFLIILGTLIIIGISFGIYKFRCEPKSQASISTQNTSTITFAAKPDEIANWKTYENEEYGYSISYPPDWKTATSSGIFDEKTELKFQTFTVYKSKGVNYDKVGVVVNFQGDLCNTGQRKTDIINVSGYPGEKLVCYETSESKPYQIALANFKKGENNYLVLADIKDELVTIEKILSTFKFL